MHFGPRVRERFGNGARQALWVLIILFMVLLANLGLRLLRGLVLTDIPQAEWLGFEIVFAASALLVGLALVLLRVRGQRSRS